MAGAHDPHGASPGADDERRDVDWDAAGERYARTRARITGTAPYAFPVAGALATAPPGPVLDVGAGTGIWSALLAEWTGRRVVAVEPAAGMYRHAAASPRAGAADVPVVAGRAEALPVRAGAAGGAWLSVVLHHVGDLGACARSLRHALAPGAPVLVRGVFAGRADQLGLSRYFPATRRRFDRYPTVEATVDAFRAAGFGRATLDRVTEPPVDLRAWRRHLPEQRLADTSLVHLSDAEFDAGLARIDADVAAGVDHATATFDLLVLR